VSLFNRPAKTLEERYFTSVRPQLYQHHGIHRQRGVREHRTLAEHLDSACQFSLTVSRLAQVPEPERAVLLAATAVHDLNKLDTAERSVKTLARNTDFLQAQLKRACVDQFVPDAQALELARKLIERHSGHNVTDGARFLPEDERIEQWASILRAADLFDLELPEEKIFGKLRTELIHAFNRPCELFRVRCTADQGYSTALLLGACETVLQHQGYHPLALFADGFLVEGKTPLTVDLSAEIAAVWQQKIDQVFGGNLEQLVRPTKDGIKVSGRALQFDSSEILTLVSAQLERKRAGFKAEKVKGDIAKWGAQKVGEAGVQAALEQGLLPVATADDFAVAEGLKAAYLSYREGSPQPSPPDVWQTIGHHVGLSDEHLRALEPFDPLYGKALFAAQAAKHQMEGVQAALADSFALRQAGGDAETTGASEELQRAVRRSLSLPGMPPILGGAELLAYVEASPKQRCCLGATLGETAPLGSDQMPIGTKIQMFSNRLPGGMSGDPVRQADPQVALAYQLMAVGAHLPAAKKEPPYYLHFQLPAGSSPALLELWQDWLQQMVATNAEGGPVTLDELKLYRDQEMVFKPNKVVGIAFPKRKEFVYSSTILPLTWGDTPASLALLKSLRLALELALAPDVGFPFVLSAGLQVETTDGLFGRVEGIPTPLQALLTVTGSPLGAYDRTTALEIRDRLRNLSQLALAVSSLSKLDDCIYDLARACSQPFSLYFVLLRWLLRSQDEPNLPASWSRLRAPLHHLLESLMPTETSALTRYLRQAAQIAAEANLRGSSNKRTSMVEPFSEFLTAARGQKPHMDLEFMFAALVQNYHTRLDRIREHGVGLTKLEHLKNYYGVLRQLYEQVYQARPDKLLSDQKNLEAAYLFFLEEARRELRERNKATEADGEEADQDTAA
jgi:CRISPR-associated protein Csc3